MIDIGKYTLYLSNGVVYYTSCGIKGSSDSVLHLTHSEPIKKINWYNKGFYFISEHEITYFAVSVGAISDKYRLSTYKLNFRQTNNLSSQILGEISSYNHYHAYFHRFDSPIIKVISVDDAVAVQLVNYEFYTLGDHGQFKKFHDFSNLHYKIKSIVKCCKRYYIYTSGHKLYFYKNCDPDRIYFYEICSEISITDIKDLEDNLIILDNRGCLYHYTRKYRLLSVPLYYNDQPVFVQKMQTFYYNIVVIGDDNKVYRGFCGESCNISLTTSLLTDALDVINFKNHVVILDIDDNLYIDNRIISLSNNAPIINIYISNALMYIIYRDNQITQINLTASREIIEFIVENPIYFKHKYGGRTSKSARKI